MKTLNLGITCTIFLLNFNIVKAQIMSVDELDRGNVRTILLSQKQIIDINASLEIKLSKTELLKAIQNQFPQYQPQVEMQSNIDAIRNVLINQEAILNSLEAGVENAESQQEFFGLMEVLLQTIQNNTYLNKRYEELAEEFFTIPNPEAISLEAFIFSRFNKEVSKLNSALDTIESAPYFISLVASTKNKQGGNPKVHVRNFDNHTERDYVTIDRWVTSLSETQQEELKEIAKLAKENDKKAVFIFENLKLKLKDFLPDTACLIEQKNELIALLSNSEIQNQISEAFTAQTTDFIDFLSSIINSVKSLDTNIALWSISTPFEIQKDLKSVLNSTQNLSLKFDGLQSLATTVNALKPIMDNLENDITVCLDDFEMKFRNLKKTITLLKFQQSNYTLNKKVGDEVKTFTLDNLPDVGFINLKGTGNRANGDELVLEMVLRIPSEKEGLPEQKFVLEQRSFYMQLIGARSEVVIGMILANPWNFENQSSNTDREFFYAPTASLVIKFGSKSSYFYNEFIDFGIGLNFASPDFNTDGTPEFGTGLIVTGFRDILSFGINYNVTLDEPYWFFGINLPFALPGLPVNAIQN